MTLIALVVTMVVLIILAVISINVVLGENGLIKNAEKGAKFQANAEVSDSETLSVYDRYIADLLAEKGEGEKEEEKEDENPGVLEEIGANTYEINSIEDLVALSYSINKAETTYQGKIIKLGKNLDFADDLSYVNPEAKYLFESQHIGYKPDENGTGLKEQLLGDNGFIPIATPASGGFYGTFDGNNKTIKNMKITNVTIFGGLIGTVRENTELNVINLGMMDENILGNGPTGGIVGYINTLDTTVNITNCYTSGTVSSSAHTGGIIGYISTASSTINITNCYNDATISCSQPSGGIVGKIEGGITITITIEECYNTGTVSSIAPVGGILGYTNNSSSEINITNSYNTGTISSTNQTGGIVGSTGGRITITQCHNEGEVSSNSAASGGIAGIVSGTIENCYNLGNINGDVSGGIAGIVSGTITQCHNEGKVSSNSAPSGGIVGSTDGAITITQCYNEGEISSILQTGGILGYTNNSSSNINITNSYNTGTVSSTSSQAGGITGDNLGTITQCYNSGAISSSDESSGGIAGDNSGTITQCYNSGEISSSNAPAGGIVGFNVGTIEDCYNRGYISGYIAGGIVGAYNNGSSIKNCYNAQKINSKENMIGGIAGTRGGGCSVTDIENCYYIDATAPIGIYSEGQAGEEKAIKKEQIYMQTDTFLEALKVTPDNTIWKREEGQNDSMPMLSWEEKHENNMKKHGPNGKTLVTTVFTTGHDGIEAEDKYGNSVKIPGGFRISSCSGETVKEGIVIQDNEGNQFVWIPVSNISGDGSNKIKIDETNEVEIILGRYNTAYGSSMELIQKGSEWNKTENAIDSKYGIYSNEMNSSGSMYKGYELATKLEGQNEVAKNLSAFIESVNTNKGYYIARYEASYSSGNSVDNYKPASKETSVISTDSMSYTQGTLWNFITQSDASKISQNMYNGNSYVESDLVNSYAWDTALIYIKAMENTLEYETNDEKCKIINMNSNFREWTTEYGIYIKSMYENSPCVARGLDNSSGAYRMTETTTFTSKTYGFRPIIYCK